MLIIFAKRMFGGRGGGRGYKIVTDVRFTVTSILKWDNSAFAAAADGGDDDDDKIDGDD